MDLKPASISVNQSLGNHEPQADAFRINLCRAEKFAKLIAELGYFIWRDAFATVADMHSHETSCRIVTRKNANKALLGELQRILDQVYQDLLESKLVPQY